MGKRSRRFDKQDTMLLNDNMNTKPERGNTSPIKPKTEAQKAYLNAIKTSTLTFGIGPAGTGKTFIATTHAADMLRKKEIERLIITRPAVEAGESLGYLPGEIDEKFDPYFAPVREILNKRLGKGHTEGLIAAGRIVTAPLAYMRGTTFENAFVIFDEAQNCTPKQMQLFLTRIGNHTTVVVDGDLAQQDIPGKSGLAEAMNMFTDHGWCSRIDFTADDVVRSGVARDIVQAYNEKRQTFRFEAEVQEFKPAKLDIPDFMKSTIKGLNDKK